MQRLAEQLRQTKRVVRRSRHELAVSGEIEPRGRILIQAMQDGRVVAVDDNKIAFASRSRPHNQ